MEKENTKNVEVEEVENRVQETLFQKAERLAKAHIRDTEELDVVLEALELAEVYEQYIDATTNLTNLQQYIQNLVIRINTLR